MRPALVPAVVAHGVDPTIAAAVVGATVVAIAELLAAPARVLFADALPAPFSSFARAAVPSGTRPHEPARFFRRVADLAGVEPMRAHFATQVALSELMRLLHPHVRQNLRRLVPGAVREGLISRSNISLAKARR